MKMEKQKVLDLINALPEKSSIEIIFDDTSLEDGTSITWKKVFTEADENSDAFEIEEIKIYPRDKYFYE